MSFTKFAAFEDVEILGVKGSQERVRTAGLDKFADFEEFRTEDGFLYARIRAISSRVNKNHDGWPSIELAGSQEIFDRHTAAAGDGFVVEANQDADYGFSTFLGKPIFIDHNNSDPSRARGVIVDAKFYVEDHKTSSTDPYYSSSSVDPEHLPPCHVELLLEIDAKSFPKLAKAIIEGSRNPKKGIDGFSMGCDVEKSVCSICKNAATTPDEFCKHVRLKGATFDYFDRKGHKTSRRSYENCYGIKFFEISAVFDPADETALTKEIRSSVQHEAGPLDPKTYVHPGTQRELPQDLHRFRGVAEPGDQPCMNCHEGVNNVGSDMQCPWCGESTMGPGGEAFSQQLGEGLGFGRQGGIGNPDCEHCRGMGCTACTPDQEHVDENGQRSIQLPPDPSFYQWMDRLKEQQPCPRCQGAGCPECDRTGVGLPENQRYISQVRTAMRRVAENPLPQSDLLHAPDEINTLREEVICPVCGSNMDEETCDICGYTEPPEGFDNPDLEKAQQTNDELRQSPEQDAEGEPKLDLGSPDQGMGQSAPTQQPNNPQSFAHVTSDMSWELSHKVAGRINPQERPITSSGPATDEPQETIIKDQTKPVTSSVRTAQDFIEAAGRNKETNMSNERVAADPAPGAENQSGHTVDHDHTRVDVTDVGATQEGTNEEASKADAQINVLEKGGTPVKDVSADESENVDQGDEHSKNIDSIPTKTWHGDQGDSLGQRDPVSGEPFPASEDGVKQSAWTIEGLDAEPYPTTDNGGGDDGGLAGGNTVKGVQPADPVGVAEDRVDVLDPTSTPNNNSGPTKTWSGTDGNGVLRQQEPVTTDAFVPSEDGVKSSAHIFSAFRLADLEIELGLLPSEKKYERVAQLEQEAPSLVEASLRYAQRVKTAGLGKTRTASVGRVPVLGRPTEVKEASVEEPEVESDPDFLW